MAPILPVQHARAACAVDQLMSAVLADVIEHADFVVAPADRKKALASDGASAEVMQHFEKSFVGADKWLMQLGTLSGDPVAATAGLKTKEILRRTGSYEKLRAIGKTLQDMQSDALTKAGVPQQICGDETLFDVFFTTAACRDYRSTKHDDPAQNAAYNAALRKSGIFKSPGKLYPSLAITDAVGEHHLCCGYRPKQSGIKKNSPKSPWGCIHGRGRFGP